MIFSKIANRACLQYIIEMEIFIESGKQNLSMQSQMNFYWGWITHVSLWTLIVENKNLLKL